MAKKDKDHLFVDDSERWLFRLTWYLADDDDIGGTLGDGDRYTLKDLERVEEGDRNHVAATLALQEMQSEGKAQRDGRGFYWESRTEATRALVVVNQAIKGQPWPDWAVKAKAAGWKPPRGWKP
jgi:hypothetical protein